MKTQEKLAIEGPSAAFKAVRTALKSLIANPGNARELDGTTQVPVAIQITREDDAVGKEYLFEVTRDGAGLTEQRTKLPESQKILLPA